MAGLAPWGTEEVVPESELIPSHLGITFGVELEFFMLCPLPNDWQSMLESFEEGEARRVAMLNGRKTTVENSRRAIVTAFQRAGLDTLYFKEDPSLTQYCVKFDGSVMDTGETSNPTLLLARGELANMDQIRDRTVFTDVEINTRVLHFNIESLQEVSTAVEVVKRFPTWCNDTTGLHVHVGNGYDPALGFNLKTLKNFCHLVCTAAHQLNELHTSRRTTTNYAYQNFMQFAPEDRTPFRMARIIENFETVEELTNFMHLNRNDRDTSEENPISNHHMAYNFMNLSIVGGKRTIEFRQHEGTLDEDMIWRWVFCVCTLIQLSSNTRNPYVHITAKVHDPNYSIIDLFLDLGLQSLAQKYFPHVYFHDRSIPFPDPVDD